MFYSKTILLIRISTITLLFCFALLVPASGQPSHKAVIPSVSSDNFYAIDLPYPVLGVASPDLSDLRITERGGREIAWLLREEQARISDPQFIPFPAEIAIKNRQTEVLIRTDRLPVSSFVLRLKSADTNKEAILLGSDDSKQWFVVKERLVLSNILSPQQTELYHQVSFPLSDYDSYKLILNDSLSAPLNILEVGRIKNDCSYTVDLLEVPLKEFRIATKEKQTSVEAVLPFQYEVVNLLFYISAPRYYQRPLFLHDYPSGILSDKAGYPQAVQTNQYSDTLRLNIPNGDDQPLTIDSIKVYTRKKYAIADLKAGEHYTLTYGDSSLDFPQYDLSFESRLPEEIEHLTVGQIEPIPSAPKEQESVWVTFFKQYGLWLIIGVVVVQILYVVRRITKSL